MSLLDFKDAKNLIIYLLTACIGMAIYVYQDDQREIKDSYKNVNSSVSEGIKELKDICAEFKEDLKEVRAEQKTMAVDISRLKALEEK